MTKRDFYDWENGLNPGKFALFKPLLCNVQVVMFKKSETKMFWKESYLQEEFQSCIFLLKKLKPRLSLESFLQAAVSQEVEQPLKKLYC